MSYTFNMYGLSALIKDMRKHNQDLDSFEFIYNHIKFEVIIDISIVPFQLLLSTALKNWACVLELHTGYSTSISTNDFFALCKVLDLKPSKETFTSFAFLSYINVRCPKACSLKPVQPKLIMPFRKKYISNSDEPNKTIFLGWNDHKLDKRKAHNFGKTELFLGKRVADYCRKNNISSLWTTPDKASERKVTYPEGYKLL